MSGGISPWMNSAPRSIGTGQSGMSRTVCTRPPIRSRASRTRTLCPAALKRAAAANPETPAPSTRTSLSVDEATLAFGDEALKSWLEGGRHALPVTHDIDLWKEHIRGGHPRGPVVIGHRTLET